MDVYSDNAEILLKVALKIITLTPYPRHVLKFVIMLGQQKRCFKMVLG